MVSFVLYLLDYVLSSVPVRNGQNSLKLIGQWQKDFDGQRLNGYVKVRLFVMAVRCFVRIMLARNSATRLFAKVP